MLTFLNFVINVSFERIELSPQLFCPIKQQLVYGLLHIVNTTSILSEHLRRTKDLNLANPDSGPCYQLHQISKFGQLAPLLWPLKDLNTHEVKKTTLSGPYRGASLFVSTVTKKELTSGIYGIRTRDLPRDRGIL